MKIRTLALAASLAAIGITSAVTVDRRLRPGEGAVLPRAGLPHRRLCANGNPWANGYVDYLKLVNAQGGINGVKISFEECEFGYATDRGVECYERLKGKMAAPPCSSPSPPASPSR